MKKLETLLLAFAFICIAVALIAAPLEIDRILIKADKYDGAVELICNDAMADIWDWQNPGRLHVGPPCYSPTNENAKSEFGAFVNTGWMVHTNGELVGWIEYRVSDIQTDFNITPQWATSIRQALQKVPGFNVNKDVEIIKQ